jgi:hypothetical protein
MVKLALLRSELKQGVDPQLKGQPPSLPRGAFHDLIVARPHNRTDLACPLLLYLLLSIF